MQQVWLALIIGLMLGWGIELLIDWQYWRRRMAALREENAQLRSQLATLAPQTPTAPVAVADSTREPDAPPPATAPESPAIPLEKAPSAPPPATPVSD